MSTTTYKTLDNSKEMNSDIVVQITKNQMVTFFKVVLSILMVIVNILAFASNSSLLSELIIAQVIVVLVFIIKNHKSNQILNS
jgi:hypothetical protein